MPTLPSIAERAHPKSEASFEHVLCPLCGSDRAQPVLSATDAADPRATTLFHVVCCSGCGLHYTNPRPRSEAIGRFYSPDYRPHAGKSHHERPLRGWYPFDWLKVPPSSRLRPRLLDFGCGAGHFLAQMDRHGWEAVGIDMSETAIQAIRREIGLTAFAGSLPHDELEPASFDLLTMWHSLEHVHDPARILREARRLLAPSGRLIVAVPDFAGWPRHWFGPAWYGLDLPRHLTHFTPRTLTTMLEKTGFRVLGKRHPRHADWMRNSALLAGRRRARRLGQAALQFRPIARVAASLCHLARRSDVMIVLATPARV